jgi:hypothetical protein
MKVLSYELRAEYFTRSSQLIAGFNFFVCLSGKPSSIQPNLPLILQKLNFPEKDKILIYPGRLLVDYLNCSLNLTRFFHTQRRLAG